MVQDKPKEVEKEKVEKEKEAGDEFLELDTSSFDEKLGVNVKIDVLENYSDTERVQGLLRQGSVIFLKIRDLREKDINELKRAVEKLRKTCSAMNGDIVGVDEDYLIITPSFAKVFRGK
jgi:SepF-like predicted cell division protein (DUF552 family)